LRWSFSLSSFGSFLGIYGAQQIHVGGRGCDSLRLARLRKSERELCRSGAGRTPGPGRAVPQWQNPEQRARAIPRNDRAVAVPLRAGSWRRRNGRAEHGWPGSGWAWDWRGNRRGDFCSLFAQNGSAASPVSNGNESTGVVETRAFFDVWSGIEVRMERNFGCWETALAAGCGASAGELHIFNAYLSEPQLGVEADRLFGKVSASRGSGGRRNEVHHRRFQMMQEFKRRRVVAIVGFRRSRSN